MAVSESNAEAYHELLRQTRELYRSSAQRIVHERPDLISDPDSYVELLDDLHRGLVLRVFLTVCRADHQWTAGETDLAVELCEHLSGSRLRGAELNKLLTQAAKKVDEIAWETLVSPFARLAPLRDRSPELLTLVVRQSNLVARIDGVVAASELGAIQSITRLLEKTLGASGRDAIDVPEPLPQPLKGGVDPPLAPPKDFADPAAVEATRSLDDVLADLDRLIGLRSAKEELRSLANYIALQQRRSEAGLPATDISLHLVFSGNPGTGKTTVARLFGEAMRAMGVLPAGQLVETDRSGLVAEYAGQTGPKANRKIDEALGGVLFIDEAYSLVDSGSDDPFGREAIQTLLKRAEDDRARLAVVLAGYPNEMAQLLDANPGLASRFSRTLRFEDYSPLELCGIFGCLMETHHYRLSRDARLRVVQAIHALHASRDRGFGNGRAVRNLFERSILRMANRIAKLPELADEGLFTFELTDIPWEADTPPPAPPTGVLVECPECGLTKAAGTEVLGAAVRCPQCDARFSADWCEPVA